MFSHPFQKIIYKQIFNQSTHGLKFQFLNKYNSLWVAIYHQISTDVTTAVIPEKKNSIRPLTAQIRIP